MVAIYRTGCTVVWSLILVLFKVVKVDPPVSLVPAGEGCLELRRLAASVHCLDDDPVLDKITC